MWSQLPPGGPSLRKGARFDGDERPEGGRAGARWLTRKREVEKKKRGQTKPSEEKMVGKNGRFER